jgi:hypothetical protein
MRPTLRVICSTGGILGVAFACGPISPPSGLAAPINACPAHTCSAYVQPGSAQSCTAGVCTVSTAMTDLVLVVSLPLDSYLAPGRSYVANLSSEADASESCVLQSGRDMCDPPKCNPPCCALPEYAQDTSSYVVDLDEAAQVGRYLGNKGTDTSLPIEATYRRLWGPSSIDAVSLGLPLEPVIGLLGNWGTSSSLGPNGARAIQSQAYLQPGCYERTMQPFAPFAQAFPPDIHTYTRSTNDPISGFDTTMEQVQGRIIPTFQIARANGLDGWTAYLRDQTTRRLLSNISPLSGSTANVTLATSHLSDPATMDALTNAELVIAPPPGTPMPSYVAAPIGPPGSQVLPEQEPYPTLPTPVTMAGRVMTLQGTPVKADLIFTATDITDRTGIPFSPTSFEFSAQAQTSLDPTTGASSYSVLLPRGHYQIVVVPRDASSAQTVVSRRAGGEGDTMAGEDVFVGALSAVQGRAVVADGRPLAEALMDVVPTQCSMTSQATVVTDPSAPCMPRPAQTTTADDGSYVFALDPGGYLLRIRPADGSRLPWAMTSIVVGLGTLNVAPITIPAPVEVDMTIEDAEHLCTDNCLGNAIVRVFTAHLRNRPRSSLEGPSPTATATSKCTSRRPRSSRTCASGMIPLDGACPPGLRGRRETHGERGASQPPGACRTLGAGDRAPVESGKPARARTRRSRSALGCRRVGHEDVAARGAVHLGSRSGARTTDRLGAHSIRRRDAAT